MDVHIGKMTTHSLTIKIYIPLHSLSPLLPSSFEILSSLSPFVPTSNLLTSIPNPLVSLNANIFFLNIYGAPQRNDLKWNEVSLSL